MSSQSESGSSQSGDPKPVDLFRDTPVRFLGYANEVGEAFRPLINVNLVRATYGIAITYALADSWNKVTVIPFFCC